MEVVAGDLYELDPAALGGPFDLAYSRLFLMHQADPVRIHAATLAAARERATHLGIAADKLDDLVREIQAAKEGGYEWVSSPFYLDLALRKPTVA